MPYRLQFRGDAEPYSPSISEHFRATDNWALASQKESINGPVALLCDGKVLCFGDQLQAGELDQEPSDVEQVFVAKWTGDLLSLRASNDRYLSISGGGTWKADSHAVGGQSQFHVEKKGLRYSFRIGQDYLSMANLPSVSADQQWFTVICRRDKPAAAAKEPLTVEFLESKVGRPLSAQDIENLRAQEKQGRLNEALLDMRSKGSSDRRC